MGTLRPLFSKAIFYFVLLLGMVLTLPALLQAQGELQLDMEVTADQNTINNGGTVKFTILYSASSTTMDAYNPILEITSWEMKDPSMGRSDYVEDTSYESSYSGLYTFTVDFVNPLVAGTSGLVEFNTTLYNYSILSDTTFNFNFRFSADGAETVNVMVPITVRPGSFAPHLTKSGQDFTPYGSTEEYTFVLRPYYIGTTKGTGDLVSMTVTDTLPPGVVYVRHAPVNDSVVWDEESQSITWHPSYLRLANYGGEALSIVVRFPDPPFDIDSQIINTGWLSVELSDGTILEDGDSHTVTVVQEIPQVIMRKNLFLLNDHYHV